ncbi:MAG: glycosyltransferase [Flavobacteriaceae bacterium]|nr:glycosyltransferase [Flavobacteriaceae bacterium]
MSSSPLVSVIIPTFNRPDLLRQTLASVVYQTYENIEIIVVDDGTPGDENQKLCSEMSQINYIKIDNSGGAAKPRNIGIDNAKGELIAFLDDDDIWLPEKIEKQIAVLNANPDYDLVHGYCKIIDLEGNETGRIIGRTQDPKDKHGAVAMKMLGNWTLMMPTPLLRKSLVEKVGYFNEKMPQAGEDVEYWLRCALVSKFYYMDECLAHYRYHQSTGKQLSDHYLELPSHLLEVLKNANRRGIVDEATFRKGKKRLEIMVLKQSPKIRWKTFHKLSEINPFWFVTFGNIKLLAKKLFT